MLHRLLGELEVKIQGILLERKKIQEENCAMAQKIVELQEKIDIYEAKLKEVKELYEDKEKDSLFANMILEDLLGSLGDRSFILKEEIDSMGVFDESEQKKD
jgi:hypothetical protein